MCNQHEPELALLDIQIAGDIDGIELAELLTDQFDFLSYSVLLFPMKEPSQEPRKESRLGI